jgi:hypothetical protein
MSKRLLLLVPALILLTAAYERINTPLLMSDAAHAYLNSLTPELRAKTVIAFDSDERINWAFIPLDNRKGVALREMTPAQKHLAEALLSAALSQEGVIKAHTIMSLDQILKEMEGDKGKLERDPEKYYVSVFGEPSEKGTWGFRFEGHHISMNFTIVNGRVVASPNFFGANPAEVKQGPRTGLRALKRDEDIARAFVMSLNADQKTKAIVNPAAPREITTSNSRQLALTGEPQGIRYSELTAAQKEILDALVTEYASYFPPQIAQMRLDQYKKNQGDLRFAWMGGVNKGEGHYYLLRTPAFIIEYDNTQNGNNHIHSVWRDGAGDFGRDLLASHYATDHK